MEHPNLTELKTAIQGGKVVPFVGAGVSMAVKTEVKGELVPLFPSWRELLHRAVTEICRNGDEAAAAVAKAYLAQGRFERAAAEAQTQLGPFWNEFLRQQFTRSKQDVAGGLDLAQLLWGIGSKLVITTNYDHVLEWGCDDALYWVVQCPSGQGVYLRGELSDPTVWHLHGHFSQPDTIILTEADYQQLYGPASVLNGSRHVAALETLRDVMKSKSLLFVGFSGDDRAIGMELSRIRDLFDGSTSTHFMLVHQRELGKVAAKTAELGIKLIPFRDFGEPLLQVVQDLVDCRTSGIAPPAPPSAWGARPISNRLGGPTNSLCLLRETQFEQLTKSIGDPRKRGAILWGPHGVGKSLIARQLVERLVGGADPVHHDTLVDRFDYVVWTGITKGFQQAILGVYREIANTWRRPEIGNATDESQLSAELLALMGESQRRTLLVVDGFQDFHLASDEGQSSLDHFVKFLKAIPTGSFVLMTCPIRPARWAGYINIEVPRFGDSESLHYLRYLRESYPLDPADQDDARLAAAAGGLPKVLGAGLQLLLHGNSIDEAISQLRAINGEFFQLVQQQMAHLDRLALVVAATADCFEGNADLELIRMSTGLDRRSFNEGLRKLTLVPAKGEGREYLDVNRTVKPGLAEYLRYHNDPLESHAREMAVRGTIRFYRAHAEWEHCVEHRKALAEQLNNLRRMLTCAVEMQRSFPSSIDMQELVELTSGVLYLFHVEGWWMEAESLLIEVLRSVDQANRPCDKPLGIKLRILLGRHYAHSENTMRALRELRCSLRLAREIDDRTLQAEAVMRQGHALHRQKPYRALKLLNAALLMCDGHPERHEIAVAAVGYVAEIQNRDGQYDLALEYLDRIHGQRGNPPSPRIAAHHLRLRGDAYLGKDQRDQARAFYLKSLALSESWSDRRLRAWNLLGLAQCDSSLEYAREALDIFERLSLHREAAHAKRILAALVEEATGDAVA